MQRQQGSDRLGLEAELAGMADEGQPTDVGVFILAAAATVKVPIAKTKAVIMDFIACS